MRVRLAPRTALKLFESNNTQKRSLLRSRLRDALKERKAGGADYWQPFDHLASEVIGGRIADEELYARVPAKKPTRKNDNVNALRALFVWARKNDVRALSQFISQEMELIE